MGNYAKESYLWYKKRGICTRCHHEKAVNGQTLCEKCREQVRELRRVALAKATPADKARVVQYQRERRARLNAQGLCCSCGKAPSEPDRVLCAACLAKKRKAAKVHRDKERSA